MMRVILVYIVFLSTSLSAQEKSPILIGLDGEFGHKTSTSAEAIRRGILVAIHEINSSGGLLGGRPLELVTKDNRSVPARALQNTKEFAEMKDMVAVFCGKFSPVAIELIGPIHELKLPLLSPWAAADEIIDNGRTPNYAFRLSLRDGWAMPTITKHAQKQGLNRLGAIFPNTAWGRSNQKVLKNSIEKISTLKLVGEEWYNWGDASLLEQYKRLVAGGAQAIVLIANEGEGSTLVKEMAGLPESDRRPVLSHWGITGGQFVKMTEGNLSKVNLKVVQTYSFFHQKGERKTKAEKVLKIADELFGVKKYEDIESPVGFAHAYDLTHILAKAIKLAGSTDRVAIRSALERVNNYDGLIKKYAKPFSGDRHEALDISHVFLAEFKEDGSIRRVDDK